MWIPDRQVCLLTMTSRKCCTTRKYRNTLFNWLLHFYNKYYISTLKNQNILVSFLACFAFSYSSQWAGIFDRLARQYFEPGSLSLELVRLKLRFKKTASPKPVQKVRKMGPLRRKSSSRKEYISEKSAANSWTNDKEEKLLLQFN